MLHGQQQHCVRQLCERHCRFARHIRVRSIESSAYGLTKSLAIELARERIRVNCIAPGMVQSEMTDQIRMSLTEEQFAAIVAQHPLGLGTTWDVACAAAYLTSDAARWDDWPNVGG